MKIDDLINKEFIIEKLESTEVFSMEEFLKESPNQLNHNINISLDNKVDGNNEKEAQRIIEKCKSMGMFNYQGLNYRIFIETKMDCIIYYLLHDEYPLLLFLHEIKEKNLLNLKGVESVDIWKNHALRDTQNKIGRYWIFNYILKNYQFIMSDHLHTPDGKHFWFKLMEEALENKLKVVVYNTKEKKDIKIVNTVNIEEFYGNQNKEMYRFIIFSKNN